MALELKSFTTSDELKKFLDGEIGRIRSEIGDLLRRLEEIRIRADRLQKAQAALLKFAGEKQMPTLEAKELDLPGLKVWINPTPKQETETLEEIVKAMQTKLDTLQRIRKALEPLADFEEGVMTISVVTSDDVPRKMMIFLKP